METRFSVRNVQCMQVIPRTAAGYLLAAAGVGWFPLQGGMETLRAGSSSVHDPRKDGYGVFIGA